MKLVFLTIPALIAATVIDQLGNENIVQFALSRKDGSVLIAAKVDDSKITEGQIDGLPPEATTDSLADVNGDTMTAPINLKDYAHVAAIERRNGMYAIIGDDQLSTAPGYLALMDQVKKKKLKAFDTAYGHIDAPKSVWVGKTNRNARLINIDTKSVNNARFDLLGLVATMTGDKKLALVTWADLATWFENETTTNTENFEAIYTADTTIRSLSHVNGDRLVVNTMSTKVVLNLSPLREAKDVQVEGEDTQNLSENFVGNLPNTSTVAYVDFATDDNGAKAIVRFQPKSALSPELQSYAA